jgi:hypothetical protein
MKRLMAMTVLAAAIMATGATESQAAGLFNRGGSGGIFARLNKPLVPAQPGLPTVSPLGLISPRMSNAVLIFQKGGFTTPAGRLAALGVVSPRISPAVALVRTPPVTPQAPAQLRPFDSLSPHGHPARVLPSGPDASDRLRRSLIADSRHALRPGIKNPPGCVSIREGSGA